MDDNGRVHKFHIPGLIYNPAGHCLLSPQHWAQHSGEIHSHKAAGCVTTAELVTLFWGNKRFQKTIRLSKGSNVADLYLAPDYADYARYTSEIGNVEGTGVECGLASENFSSVHDNYG